MKLEFGLVKAEKIIMQREATPYGLSNQAAVSAQVFEEIEKQLKEIMRILLFQVQIQNSGRAAKLNDSQKALRLERDYGMTGMITPYSDVAGAPITCQRLQQLLLACLDLYC